MQPTAYPRLWRFNAVVIAIIGVAGLLLIGIFLAFVAKDTIFRERDAVSRQIGPETAGKNRLVLNDDALIEDSTLQVFRLGRASDNSSPYSSEYRAGDDRNILVIDRRDGSSRTILPDNKRRIINWRVLGASATGQARAYVALVQQPTREGAPAAATPGDVLVGNFLTGRQQWIARGVRSLEAANIVDDDSVATMTLENDGLVFRRIDLATLDVRVIRPVAIDPVSPD